MEEIEQLTIELIDKIKEVPKGERKKVYHTVIDLIWKEQAKESYKEILENWGK